MGFYVGKHQMYNGELYIKIIDFKNLNKFLNNFQILLGQYCQWFRSIKLSKKYYIKITKTGYLLTND